MKNFANRRVTKKLIIVILTVLLLTFSVPKPVNAVGGILMSPIITLSTSLVDAIQHLLEWAMLGETSDFMKDLDGYQGTGSTDGALVEKQNGEIDGSLWGIDDVNIPVIQYTPEEIFSNRVPALDVNFISPSVKTGNSDWDKDHNIAMRLQPTIASWYVAIRTLALVGLLSVLVYLGIRMLLTSVAADKAKYKKMIMDWIVAICLLFALHYIMSFALTMSEVITSMIGDASTGSITVNFSVDGQPYTFTGNLMSYVRFMIQDVDKGLGFFFLYLMLMIYTIRFTWTYLKRVVNMAFLTLIAPVVALTYPIDKVTDGKAQAFDMWIKEFAYNALLQPLHLLLYIVLLGSATELATINPLYAVVCLGFIFAGEKLFKKMFGFDKAGAGTVGSLAGAAGVSALAHKGLMMLGKGPHGGKGGAPGKVRTNDKFQRQGKDPGANKGFNSFDKDGNKGLEQLDSGNNEGDNTPSPSQNANNGNNGEQNTPPSNNGEEIQSLNDRIQNGDFGQESPSPQGSEAVQEAMQNLGPEQPETWAQTMDRIHDELDQEKAEANRKPTWRSLREADKKEKEERKQLKDEERSRKRRELGMAIGTEAGRKEIGRKLGVGAYKTIKGIKAAAPTMAYKAVRGAGKTALRVGMGAALGVTAGVIGATTGDGEKALSAAGAAFAVGAGTGGRVFESTVGDVARDKSVRDAFDSAKYGSAIDARNARADKAYLKSDEHKDEYEKYWKGTMDRKTYDKAVKEYRQAGITDTKTIRNALKLENQYKNNNKRGESDEDIRGKVQNIVQTYDNIDKKAVYGSDSKATEAALKNLESQLTKGDAKQKRAIANEILQGYRDWYNI